MKSLFVVAVLTFSTFAFAQTPPAKKPLTHLTCGLQGSRLSVQFDGPRYGDRVSVALSEDELKPLLLPAEQSVKTQDESISGFMEMGSCDRVNDGSNVIVTCGHLKGKNWASLHYTFSQSQEIAPGVDQQVRITRRLGVESLQLKVTNLGDHLQLEITALADNGLQKNIPLKVSRNLGPLGSVWNGCAFTEDHYRL